MKLGRVEVGGRAVTAVAAGDAVRLLERTSVLELLAMPATERARTVEREATGELPLAEARVLAPVAPPSVRDFLSFEEHVEGMVKGEDPSAPVPPHWYESPTFYYSSPGAVVGPYEDVPVPPGCEVFDFELEVAAVVGAPGANLSVEQARDHIAAYTIFNDWSARDLQRNEMARGFGPVKGKDSSTTLGPWLVTADELEPHRDDELLDLELEVFLNGERFGHDTLANMSWSFEALLAFASRGTRVVTGDVIGSGTCGSGCLGEIWGRRGRREPPPLRPGDVVRMTVEGIGTIENRVVDRLELHPVPAASRPTRRRPRDW